jgi:hypothetical protein
LLHVVLFFCGRAQRQALFRALRTRRMNISL